MVRRRAFVVFTSKGARILDDAVGARLTCWPEFTFKYALVTLVDTDTKKRLTLETKLNLRLVIATLRVFLPVKVAREVCVNSPGDQSSFGLRFGVVTNEPIYIIGVGATIEAHIRAIVARTA